jgi:hypothetical protein
VVTVKPEYKRRRVLRSVRFTEPEDHALQLEAKKEKRDISSYVRHITITYLESRGYDFDKELHEANLEKR